ncbi:MAG: DUF1345 domain-containing protein [Candidatus Eremiobacteraeota bacterium]|nr:DUF1345 domain-containing protein [Candidatus Eremiobacteraeota bacterium]
MAIKLRPESRLPAIIAVVLLVALVASMPARFMLIGPWMPYVVGVALIMPMIAATLSPVGSRWARTEHWLVMLLVVVTVVIQLYVLKELIQDILVHDRSLEPTTLLATSVALWVTNVLLFALFYYQLDRGGPDARDAGRPRPIEFSFASTETQEGEPERGLTFTDYLFLSFTSATAFSPTDTLPMTPRAKLVMMAQATISLTIIVLVAARSINILR